MTQNRGDVKRAAIGPFLATGVAMVGAAAIVANPVVLPPADVRVSAAEYAASGGNLDVLDPRFLEMIDASQRGWQNPVEVLESLLSAMVENDSDSLAPLASALASFIDTGDPALLASALSAIDDLQAGQYALSRGLGAGVLGNAPGPWGPEILDGFFSDGSAREIVIALADIGSGFGEAGVNFIQQVGIAPAALAELAQQVQAGTMEPGEALRRIIVVPFTALTGYREFTGNPEIDSLFTRGVLRPVVDAVGRNLPGGQQGSTSTLDDGTTEAAAAAQDRDRLSTPQVAGNEQLTDQANTAEADPADDGTGDEDGNATVVGNGPSSDNRGGLADRVTKTINDFGNAFRVFAGGNGQNPGQGTGSAPGTSGPAAGPPGSSTGGAPGSPGSPAGG